MTGKQTRDLDYLPPKGADPGLAAAATSALAVLAVIWWHLSGLIVMVFSPRLFTLAFEQWQWGLLLAFIETAPGFGVLILGSIAWTGRPKGYLHALWLAVLVIAAMAWITTTFWLRIFHPVRPIFL